MQIGQHRSGRAKVDSKAAQRELKSVIFTWMSAAIIMASEGGVGWGAVVDRDNVNISRAPKRFPQSKRSGRVTSSVVPLAESAKLSRGKSESGESALLTVTPPRQRDKRHVRPARRQRRLPAERARGRHSTAANNCSANQSQTMTISRPFLLMKVETNGRRRFSRPPVLSILQQSDRGWQHRRARWCEKRAKM